MLYRDKWNQQQRRYTGEDKWIELTEEERRESDERLDVRHPPRPYRVSIRVKREIETGSQYHTRNFMVLSTCYRDAIAKTSELMEVFEGEGVEIGFQVMRSHFVPEEE